MEYHFKFYLTRQQWSDMSLKFGEAFIGYFPEARDRVTQRLGQIRCENDQYWQVLLVAIGRSDHPPPREGDCIFWYWKDLPDSQRMGLNGNVEGEDETRHGMWLVVSRQYCHKHRNVASGGRASRQSNCPCFCRWFKVSLCTQQKCGIENLDHFLRV